MEGRDALELEGICTQGQVQEENKLLWFGKAVSPGIGSGAGMIVHWIILAKSGFNQIYVAHSRAARGSYL